MSPLVLVDRPREGVARIALNRPDKRNALSPALRDALLPAVEEALADEAVRALVLCGSGGTFCAGGDIGTMARMTPADARRRMQRSHALVHRLAMAEKPVVAAVEGYAVGAGAGLALLADVIVAGKGAKLGFPFFKVGLVPDYGILYTLPRRVGLGRARHLLLTGRNHTAAEALGWGLVDEVVPDADVLGTALDLAAELTTRPPHAINLMRRVLASMPGALEPALEMEAMAQSLCFAGDELEEGARAFMEKRAPRF